MIELHNIPILKKFRAKKQKRFNWQDYLPHPHLESKLRKLITHIKDIQNAKFFHMDFDLVKFLIQEKIISNDFSLFSKHIILKEDNYTQKISTHSKKDKDLLKESMNKKIPIEVMRITIKTSSLNSFDSPITFGTENSVSSQIQIESWIHENIFKLKKNGHSIKSVHIDHTHPSLEVFIQTKNKYFFVTNGLGDRDLLMAQNIADHLSYPLIISAIIPSGLKYSALF